MERTLNNHERRGELEKIFAAHPVYAAKCELECRKVKEMFFSNPEMWQDTPAGKTFRLETKPPIYFDIGISPQDMEEILSMPLLGLHGRSWRNAFHGALLDAKKHMRDYSPRLVLLTGGASRMAFTSDCCKEVFPSTEVMLGVEPEFAIARGLAGAGRIELKTKAFRSEVEALFGSGRLKQAIESQLPALINSIARFFAKKFPEEVVLPAFCQWREGRIRTLNDLERVIQPRATEWLASAEGKQQLAEVVAGWFKSLKPGVEKLTDPISDKYHIPQTALNLSSFLGLKDMGALQGKMADMEKMTGLDNVSGLVIVVGSIIIATILGGGGTALLIHGPLGWIIGLIIGIAAMLIGTEAMMDSLKNADLPGLSRWLITEGRVQKALNDKQQEFEEQVRESLNKNIEAFSGLLDNISESIQVALNEAADKAALLLR